MPPTAKDVAQWMLAEVRKGDWVHQEVIVYEIERVFGEDFVYTNQNGNPAISRDVLKQFNSISGQEVVWERGDRAWRLRAEGDAPGRQQS